MREKLEKKFPFLVKADGLNMDSLHSGQIISVRKVRLTSHESVTWVTEQRPLSVFTGVRLPVSVYQV